MPAYCMSAIWVRTVPTSVAYQTSGRSVARERVPALLCPSLREPRVVEGGADRRRNPGEGDRAGPDRPDPARRDPDRRDSRERRTDLATRQPRRREHRHPHERAGSTPASERAQRPVHRSLPVRRRLRARPTNEAMPRRWLAPGATRADDGSELERSRATHRATARNLGEHDRPKRRRPVRATCHGQDQAHEQHREARRPPRAPATRRLRRRSRPASNGRARSIVVAAQHSLRGRGRCHGHESNRRFPFPTARPPRSRRSTRSARSARCGCSQ